MGLHRRPAPDHAGHGLKYLCCRIGQRLSDTQLRARIRSGSQISQTRIETFMLSLKTVQEKGLFSPFSLYILSVGAAMVEKFFYRASECSRYCICTFDSHIINCVFSRLVFLNLADIYSRSLRQFFLSHSANLSKFF